MTDPAPRDQILHQLEATLAQKGLPDSARRTGERLLARLTGDVRVLVCGAPETAVAFIATELCTRALEDVVLIDPAGTDAAALDTADICLWCTHDFGDDEWEAWQAAPNRLKDHSFLVPVSPRRRIEDRARLARLQTIAEEEFYRLVPVWVGAEDTAPDSAADLDRLARELTGKVSLGRVADMDHARYFLKTHPVAVVAPSSPAADPPQAPQAPRLVPPAATAPTPALPPDPSAGVGKPGRDPALRGLYVQALDRLLADIAPLEALAAAEGDRDIAAILEICRIAGEALAEGFAPHRAEDPDFRALRDDVLSAADQILLLSLEQGALPAATAVTLLLQSRRDLEARLAA